MTDRLTIPALYGLLDRWVTVTHPDAPSRVWHGRLTAVWEAPSIVLETPGGGREQLPASFNIQRADPADALRPGPAGAPRPWTDLRTSGLLWLINRTTFHPRGAALAVHTDKRGAFGWSLMANEDREPYTFDPATNSYGYERAEATLAAAGIPAPRLLACGLCYEETGEEVHPHPACIVGLSTAELHARRRHPDFEYATTEGPRKQWDDVNVPPTDDDGTTDPAWERNTDAGRDGWERFDYTEESYWRRLKPPRLLACGLCYEEHGEEVHPHPECPKSSGPAVVEARACTASLLEPFHGRARCERHHTFHPNTGRPGLWHEGRSQDGSTIFWQDGDNGATPHVQTMSGPRCITIHAPGEATVLAARYLDISEGPVQIGYKVDASTRSAITQVLAYIAKAHNSPPDTGPDTDTDSPDNTRTTDVPDTDPHALTSTDTVQTPRLDTGPDMSATDGPDTARTTRPDTSPDGVRTVWTAHVPRRHMAAALLEGLAVTARIHDEARGEATTAATVDEPQPDPDDEDLTLGPDGLTDTERERKTIRDAMCGELSQPDEDAVWDLTLAIHRALRAMPRYRTGNRADELAHPATTAQVTAPDEVDENPAPLLHLVHGTVPLHEHLAVVQRSVREITTLRDRVSELADTLADVIGRFTLTDTFNGTAVVCTNFTPVTLVEQWRRTHTGNSAPDWTFPHVEGICPACRRTGLFLGSGGYVTCSHDDCRRPDAACTVLNNPPSATHTCTRPDCLDRLTTTVQAERRAHHAYDCLRIDVITAAKFIRQQKGTGPLSPLRCNRARLLTTLTTWIKDPGPLNPPTTGADR